MSEPNAVESMPQLAQVLVDVMAELGVTRLDYSAASIEFLDANIEAWWPDRRPWRRGKASRSSAASMVPVIGAYLGEVMVRQLGGTWRELDGKPWPGVDLGRFVANPFGSAAKRFEGGRAESLWTFYRWGEETVRAGPEHADEALGVTRVVRDES